MGKSVSIQQMADQSAAYRDYLKTIRDDLNKRAVDAEADMRKRADAFYTGNDYIRAAFISGRNVDFMQKSSWSLDNVKSIIDLIAGNLFGGIATSDAPRQLADGVIARNAASVVGGVAAVADLQVYIAGKCFDVLSGIIESFGNASSVTYTNAYKDIALGNGLHMFVTVICDSYKNKDFFNNEEIYEYLYIYEVYYSAQEASTQAKMQVTRLYEDQIAAFVAKSEDLLDKLGEDKITPEQYESSVLIYQKLIDASRKKLSELETAMKLAEGRDAVKAKMQGLTWRPGRKRRNPDGPWSHG